MKLSKKSLIAAVAVMLALLILFLKEGHHLLELNQHLYGDYQDALKNYYTVLYHVVWDADYWHFSGMNYPYGEHVLFTDNQPLLAQLLKIIHQHIVPLDGHLVGLLNTLLFVNVLLCVVFIYRCMLLLQFPAVYSAFMALALTFLSPQLDRMGGHFALAYSAVLPFMISQALAMLEGYRRRQVVYVVLTLTLSAFIHVYYLAFGLVIFGALAAYLLLHDSQPKNHWPGAAAMLLGPLLLMQTFIGLTDSVADRPSYPWSPFKGNFKPHGIFFPQGKPIGHWIKENFGMPSVRWEAEAYVGIFSGLLLLLMVAFIPLLLFRITRRYHLFFPRSHQARYLLWLVLFSIVVPMLYVVAGKWDWLYENMGPFRQFRAVTRVFWVLILALNFLVIVWLKNLTAHRKKYLQWLVLLLPLLTLSYDAYWHYRSINRNSHQLDAFLEPISLAEKPAALLHSYDAFIPLPFFHIGSEDFAIQTSQTTHYKNAMAYSYATGVPMTAIMLSRTSKKQTLESITYHYRSADSTAIERYLPQQKIALIYTKKAPLTPREQLLWDSKKRVIWENAELVFAEFSYSGYRQLRAQHKPHQRDKAILRHHYDREAGNPYLGGGARIVSEEEPRAVDTLSFSLDSNRTLYLKMWINIEPQTKTLEQFIIRYFREGGARLGQENFITGRHIQYVDGNWALVQFPLKLPQKEGIIHVFQKKNGLHKTPTLVDELQLSTVPFLP